MAKQPDIHRLLELQHLLLQFSQIERVIDRRHGTDFIRETDTEHSYNLAMTAWYLADYFPELDRDQVIRFALVHDLVEVHAGDTYAFSDKAELDSKADREAAALKQLESDWADFGDMLRTIHEYEARESPEAVFIYALDKIMPMMQVYINEGRTWQAEGITLERIKLAKADKVAGSPEVQHYYEQLVELLQQSPDVISPQ